MSLEPSWPAYLLVAGGGAVGAVLRYSAGRLGDVRGRVPWGTVAGNLAGSTALGLLSGAGVGGAALLLLGLGLCGSLTTYSTFAVQAHDRGLRLGALTVLVTAPPAIALYAAGRWLGGLLT